VLIAHGSHDHTTDPYVSARFADRAREFAEQLTYITVVGDGHALLRRARIWHALAAGFTVGALFNHRASGTGDADFTNVLEETLNGEQTLRM
jgi:hypothetical protein